MLGAEARITVVVATTEIDAVNRTAQRGRGGLQVQRVARVKYIGWSSRLAPADQEHTVDGAHSADHDKRTQERGGEGRCAPEAVLRLWAQSEPSVRRSRSRIRQSGGLDGPLFPSMLVIWIPLQVVLVITGSLTASCLAAASWSERRQDRQRPDRSGPIEDEGQQDPRRRPARENAEGSSSSGFLASRYGMRFDGSRRQSVSRKSPDPSGVAFSNALGRPSVDGGQPRRSVVASRPRITTAKPAIMASSGGTILIRAEVRRSSQRSRFSVSVPSNRTLASS